MDLNTIFQEGICCLLLIFVLVFAWMKTFRRPLDPRIPVFKFRYWSILGAASLIHPMRALSKQTSLDLNIYYLQTISGFSFFFQKENIYCNWVGFHPFIILNKAPIVEELLRSKKFLKKARSYRMLHPWLGESLLTSSGSKWRTRRKLLTLSFHFDILKDFQHIFNEQSNVLIDTLKTQCAMDWIDLGHYIKLCSLDIICESALGVKIGAQVNKDVEYVRAITRATKAVMSRIIIPLFWIDFIYKLLPVGRQFYKDIKLIHDFARNVLKERKSAMLMHNVTEEALMQNESTEKIKNSDFNIRKRKALLDLLLDVHLSNPEFTEEDLRGEIDTFTFAGHDTITAGLSWTFYLLGLNPDVQGKVHEELNQVFGDDTEREVIMDDLTGMNYLECVIKESLRLYPPVPLFAREIQEDRDFCDYHINKGTTLIVRPYALHRDPNTFPNPEKFDPSRFFPENCVGRHPYAYIPFSAGPRNCIGQRFAMMEMKTIAAHVMRNFALHSLEPRDRVFPSPELVMRPFYPLKIKITKRTL